MKFDKNLIKESFEDKEEEEVEKKDFFRSLAEFVIKNRFFVLITWIIVTIIASIGALKSDEVLQGEGSYVKTSESYQQNKMIIEDFPQQYLKNMVVTLKSKDKTVDDPSYKKSIETIMEFAKKQNEVGDVYDYSFDSSLVSRDKKSTFILIGMKMTTLNMSSPEAPIMAENIKKLNIDKSLELHVTGVPLIVQDMTKLSQNDSTRAEQKIFPVVIVLMIFIFGAIVSAVLPILVGVVSIVITLGILYVIGQNMELAMFCKAITSMMGLGVGLDYCLFMVSRFKEELEKGASPNDAAIHATITAGKAVCYSGLSVAIGMGVLLIPALPLSRSIGLSGMIVVGVSIVLSLTLLPVIFSYLGPRINSPRALHRLVKYTKGKQNFWLNWSNLVMKRPVMFFVTGTILLVGLSSLSLNIKLWNSSVLLMPKDLDSRIGFEKMMEIDPASQFSPVGLSFEVTDDSNIYDKKNIEKIYDFIQKTSKLEGVYKILGIVNPFSNTSMKEYENLYANTIMMQNMGLAQGNPFVSKDNKKTLFWVFNNNIEKDAADLDTVRELRELKKNFDAPNMKILVAGIGSSNIDFQNAVYADFPLIIALILIATYIIMFMMLGSVILPIKAIIMNLLSVGASYGWLVLVFQYGLFIDILGIEKTPGALMIMTPMVLFCIIFGLSMDYEIFMMSRIKEEYDKTGDVSYSIAMGLEKSGGIITSAALIMIIVFSAFSFSKVILVQEMGVGLATSVIIDATIIRIMLVPSILKILGKFAWWYPPSWEGKFKTIKLDH
ncbi:MAG: MMPL family transporter [Candidatus Sericytochromatia bacterium]